METQKECIKCNNIKLLADFYIDNTKKDGLDSWCKECKKQTLANDYYLSPDLKKEKVKSYYQKNKDIKKIKNEIYREEKRDKINKQKSEKEKLWRIENPELARAKDAEKREKNRERINKNKKISRLRCLEKSKEELKQ